MSRYSIYKNIILDDERSDELRFEPDGRKHYVYRITDLNRELEEHYYGSRSTSLRHPDKDILEDFWDYRTSSKHNTISENKENYKLKILKVFNNPADKMIYEAFLHQLFNVKLHNNFWNKSNQTPWNFDTTGMKFDNYNRPSRKGISWGNHTEEAKEKISEHSKRIYSDNKVKDKISKGVSDFAKNNPEESQKRYEQRKLNGNDAKHTQTLIIEKQNGDKIELYGQKSLKEYCELHKMSFKKMKSSIDKGLIIINENDKRTTEESKKCKNLKIYKVKKQ